MEKKWLYVIGLIILGFLAFYLYRKYHVAPTIDFNAIALVDLAENPVKFERLKGKKTVLCFSASWCPNCLTELKEISSVKSSQLSDVEIVVISDEPLEKVQSWAARTGYPFTFLKMQQPFGSIGIHSVPTSYLLNASHQVVKETVGYVDWTDPSTCQHLVKLMEE